MKAYLYLCLLIVLLVGMLWFVLPFLYSADDTILCGMGMMLTLIMIPVCSLLVKQIWVYGHIQALVKKVGERLCN